MSSASFAAESTEADDLKAQIDALKLQLETLEQKVEAGSTSSGEKADTAKSAESKPVVVRRKPNVSVEVGGFAKLNAVYSSKSVGNTQLADEVFFGSKVPRDDVEGEDSQLRMSAKESRFWLKGGNDVGRFHLEADFTGYSSSSLETGNGSAGMRMRHAYAAFNKGDNEFLFGQTWSTLQNSKANMHKTLYGELPGELLKRVVQFRWTHNFSGSSKFHMGLENPAYTAQLVNGSKQVMDDDRLPDFIVRAEMNPSWGNVSLGGIVRQFRCDEPGLCDDSTTAAALSFTGAWNISGADQLHFQASQGDGLGRYMGGNLYPEVVLLDDGTLSLVDSSHLALSYQHAWTPKVTTALLYNWSEAGGLEPVIGSDGKGAQTKLSTLSGNIMWRPAADVRFGLEWIHAESDWTDGGTGGLDRVIFSSRYDF